MLVAVSREKSLGRSNFFRCGVLHKDPCEWTLEKTILFEEHACSLHYKTSMYHLVTGLYGEQSDVAALDIEWQLTVMFSILHSKASI